VVSIGDGGRCGRTNNTTFLPLPRTTNLRHKPEMHSLPLFMNLMGRNVILIGQGEMAEAKRRLLQRAGAVVTDERGLASLAIVAVEDDAEAEAAVARLQARGILVNATDRPALCDFTLPAIIDRDPVLIAIGTGGASAGLAAALRQRIEALIPASLGKLAQALHTARPALQARYPDPRTRRQAIGAALAAHGALDPLVEQRPGAVAEWLGGATTEVETRVVSIRLTSPDPDDLTLRTARLLAQADCVCHTVDVPPAILARARADATRLPCTEPPESCGHGLCVFLSF